MTLEEILNRWEEDSEISTIYLADESIKSGKLHHKYIKMLSLEKMVLQRLSADLAILNRDKLEFYTQGETKETRAKGWSPPHKGTVLIKDADTYMNADKDIIDLSLKIGLQKEKIHVLEDILKNVHQRTYAIKNSIDFMKFQAGN